MKKKKVWIFASVITILLLISFLPSILISCAARSQSDSYTVPDSQIGTVNVDEYADKKTILLWNTMFEDEWFSFGNSPHFDHCPKYKNCLMSRTRNLVDHDKFDAIVFHGNEVKQVDKPKKRDPKQFWIFANLESPSNRPLPERHFEHLFNLTMTYRFDSDIPWPYYLIRDIDTGEVVAPLKNTKWMEPLHDPMRWSLDTTFEQKTKMSAWLVSNCITHGRRELFIRDLLEYMDVHKIGKCNKPVVPDCTDSYDDCFNKVIEPHYFFYLSFENSMCQEYVTEKLYNALSHNVVPVVYGGANYSLFAPPHSYIDALDFDTPKALADYLIELSQNKEEYMKYFWWKRFYTIGTANQWTLCKLCERLNDGAPKMYKPLKNWFEQDRCPLEKYTRGHDYTTKEIRYRVNGF